MHFSNYSEITTLLTLYKNIPILMMTISEPTQRRFFREKKMIVEILRFMLQDGKQVGSFSNIFSAVKFVCLVYFLKAQRNDSCTLNS